MKTNQNTVTVKATVAAKAATVKTTDRSAKAGLTFATYTLAYKFNRCGTDKMEKSSICTLAASRTLELASLDTQAGQTAKGFALCEASGGFFALDYAAELDGAFAICGTSVAVRLTGKNKLVAKFATLGALAAHVGKQAQWVHKDGGKVWLGAKYGFWTDGKNVKRTEIGTCTRAIRAGVAVKKTDLVAAAK